MFNKGFNKARDWYVEICARLIRHMWLSILLLAAMTALLFPLAKLIPSGFLPNEDQGYLFGGVELPDNTSLNVTADTAARIEKNHQGGSGRGRSDYRQRLQPHQLRPKLLQLLLLHLPETLVRTDCSGHDGGRHRRTPEKQAERGNFLRRGVCGSAAAPAWRRNVRGCHIPAGGPPGHRGKIPLAANTSKFIEAAEKRPEIAGISNFMSPSNLQYNLNVNTEQATLQNMDVDEIYATIQAYMGSTFLNNFNIYGQEWQVYMQADAPYRDSIDKLSMFYVRNNEGDPVPLDSVINVTHGWAPNS